MNYNPNVNSDVPDGICFDIDKLTNTSEDVDFNGVMFGIICIGLIFCICLCEPITVPFEVAESVIDDSCVEVVPAIFEISDGSIFADTPLGLEVLDAPLIITPDMYLNCLERSIEEIVSHL